jgi:hypothetical protein
VGLNALKPVLLFKILVVKPNDPPHLCVGPSYQILRGGGYALGPMV